MKCLEDMRAEMNRRKELATRKQQDQKVQKQAMRNTIPPKPTIGRVLEKTPVVAAQEVRDPLPVKPMNKAQTEALLKGGQNVLREPIPEGYRAVSRNQTDVAEAYREAMLNEFKVCAYDFETDADQEEGVDILHDKIVGVSFSYEAGKAIYIPIGHNSYAANWAVEDVIEMFRSVWESKDVLKIAWNAKFEHQILLRYGVRMPYESVADPMIMVMLTGQFEELALKKVTSEILPYLFDKYAEEVLTDVLSEEELNGIMIDDGDEDRWINDPDAWNDERVVSLAEYKERKQKKIFWDAYVNSFKDVTKLTVQDGVYKSGKNKGQPKWKKTHVSFNEMPINKKTVDYGCKDSDWALQVYQKLKPILEQEGLMAVHDLLDAPFMMVLGEIELNGWRVRPDKLREMYQKADDILNKGTFDEQGNMTVKPVYEELDEQLLAVAEASDQIIDLDEEDNIIVPAGKWKLNVWKRQDVYLEIKTSKPFNWSSTQHLQWLFYVMMGINWKKLGIGKSPKTGLPSTGADEIDKMIYANPDVPFFRTLLKKREFEKIRDTYAKGILEQVQEETNRVHATLKLVRTWRLSCSKPNLQNVPRLDNDDIGIRYCFEARPGYTLVSCDYSQIELRVMAHYANDDNMRDAYDKNQDLHSRVAKEVWKLSCDVEEVKSKYKTLRYKAKAINFGICYGSTEFGLQGTLNSDAMHDAVMKGKPYVETTLEECKTTIDNYKDTFPGLVAYANEQISYARANGYVETLFGHRRPIADINHPNEWIRKSAENQCMNTPIQGSASDIIRKAMVELQKEFLRRAETDPRWKEVRMVMQIHDDVITECPEEMGLEVARLVKEIMERPLNDFLRAIGRDIDFTVPIIGEPAIGRVWANVLDVSFTEDGKGKVKVKAEKKEALDITLADLTEEDLNAYRKAGIEVWCGTNRVA